MSELKYTIHVRTLSEANRRDHWAVKMKRTALQKKLAWFYSHDQINKALTQGVLFSYSGVFKIKLTRLAQRLLDTDNLAGSMKAVRDGIAKALGRDDGPRSGIEWVYDQRQDKVKNGVDVEMYWND